MKTIGFPISHKENEKRRAMVPNDICRIINPKLMYFESGYGNVLGLSDDDYIRCGANVTTREEVLKQDIICDPKIGDADYLDVLENQIVFGWIHAVQNRNITEKLIDGNLTAYAWEDMFDRGRHVFWRNNELAGEAAIMHAFQCFGIMPYEAKVAVIGRGNTARGALRVLNMLGAEVMQYDKKTESLLRNELSDYDVIVNCVLWDTTRGDHIIYREDLKHMKRNSMIVDVSCDKNGGIETSVPTTIEDPIYYVEGIAHYAVDHTPSLFYKTFTYNNSGVISNYINMLMRDEPNQVLINSLAVKKGKIIDKRIIIFQGRNLS